MNKIYQKVFLGGKTFANPQLGTLAQVVIAGMDRQSRNKENLNKQTGSRVRARDDRQQRKGFRLIELLIKKSHSRGCGGPQGSGVSALIYHAISRFLSCGFCFINNKKTGDPRQRHSGMTAFKPFRMTALEHFRMTSLFNYGFTLIELLVVVLIVGILAAVALPQYQRAVLKSRYAQMMVLGRTLQTSADAYYLANGKYPAAWDEVELSVPGKITSGGRIWSSNGYSCRLFMGTTAMDSFLCSWGASSSDNFLGYRVVLSTPSRRQHYCLAYIGQDKQEAFCESVGGKNRFNNGADVWHYELP